MSSMSTTATQTVDQHTAAPFATLNYDFEHNQPKDFGSNAPLPQKKGSWNLDVDGRFQSFPWDISTLMIPSHIGKATTSKALQKATLWKYCTLVTFGLTLFYLSPNPTLRTAGLSVLFPGSGFLAVGGFTGAIGFVLAIAFLPLALFAWFGAGGLAYPLADWIISALAATWLTGSTIVESSAVAGLGILGIAWMYLRTRTTYEEQAEIAMKDRRNDALLAADQEWQASSQAAGPPGSRELTLEQLRYAQRIVDLALKDFDDWEGFTDIDQFQTAAVRYQLYDFVYCLSIWTTSFAPSFRGYLAAGMRNAIEKSLTPKVMSYWKWESLWGNFTTNWDPIIKDNIMVTGYMVLACGVYQSCTGDDRYEKEGSLEFRVTEKHRYKHSMHSMYNALLNNWTEHKYTLYPCEPNWVYTMCNLEGMSGAVVYDRLFKTKGGSNLLKQFYRKYEEDFCTKGGSCIPIRSGLTGFTIPGLCGIVGDCSNAITCAATLPTLAKRMWLIARQESLRWRSDGKIEAVGLKGADVIDVGNYKPSMQGAYAMFAVAAAEWGDRKIADACLERVEEFCKVKTDPYTGAKWNHGLSTLAQSWIARSRIGSGGDWANDIGVGVEDKCLNGPLLDHVPYPEVLVAKAYSHTSKDLDLVLYPGRSAGRFEVNLAQLKAGARYVDQSGQRFSADANGRATLSIYVDGRTAVNIQPALD